jgi:hypothetical protein
VADTRVLTCGNGKRDAAADGVGEGEGWRAEETGYVVEGVADEVEAAAAVGGGLMEQAGGADCMGGGGGGPSASGAPALGAVGAAEGGKGQASLACRGTCLAAQFARTLALASWECGCTK